MDFMFMGGMKEAKNTSNVGGARKERMDDIVNGGA